MNDKEQILSLKHGEVYTIPESDYGKAEVWRIHDDYLVFEIPMYGGNPSFISRFTKYTMDAGINEIDSWT